MTSQCQWQSSPWFANCRCHLSTVFPTNRRRPDSKRVFGPVTGLTAQSLFSSQIRLWLSWKLKALKIGAHHSPSANLLVNFDGMPLNVPGILVPFHLLVNPRLVIPALAVKDIRHIDFSALKRAGYRGAVFDKDNCLTIPHKDALVPELHEAWKTCRETFGAENVLIVSNSAGTYLDAGNIQSESVSHHLGVPVLRHEEFKPAYSCIDAIRTYFSSLPTPVQDRELIIVGDRIFTDIVIANRMKAQNGARSRLLKGLTLRPPENATDKQRTDSTVASATRPDVMDIPKPHVAQGPLAIWTTGVWTRESMAMRWLERKLVDAVEHWSIPPMEGTVDTSAFTKHYIEPEPPQKPTALESILSRIRRA